MIVNISLLISHIFFLYFTFNFTYFFFIFHILSDLHSLIQKTFTMPRSIPSCSEMKRNQAKFNALMDDIEVFFNEKLVEAKRRRIVFSQVSGILITYITDVRKCFYQDTFSCETMELFKRLEAQWPEIQMEFCENMDSFLSPAQIIISNIRRFEEVIDDYGEMNMVDFRGNNIDIPDTLKEELDYLNSALAELEDIFMMGWELEGVHEKAQKHTVNLMKYWLGTKKRIGDYLDFLRRVEENDAHNTPHNLINNNVMNAHKRIRL